MKQREDESESRGEGGGPPDVQKPIGLPYIRATDTIESLLAVRPPAVKAYGRWGAHAVSYVIVIE